MNAPLHKLLVGGAVRDLQLGLVPADRDWLVLGETDASMRARGFKRVGKQFQSYLHPTTGEEYALPRGFSDAEEQAGHDEVHADLAARDLTINAMALTDDQMLIDPFGGQTFDRPWFKDTMEAAKLKADVAFEMFTLLQSQTYYKKLVQAQV